MQQILIWYYHRVLPEKRSSAIDVKTFERQVLFLRESGYSFINTSDLKLWFENKINRNKKYVMLTFDDGWADNFFWATPVLAKFAAKAVIAVNTGLINKTAKKLRRESEYKIIDSKTALEDAAYGRDFSSFLTWDEIQEMSESGIWEIQAHGNSHFGCYSDLKKIKGFFPEKKHWTMRYALGEEPFPGAPRAVFISDLCSPQTVLSGELKILLRASRSNRQRMELCKKFTNPVKTVETEEDFTSRIRANFQECGRLIQENTGKKPDAMIWPWGQSSELSRKIASECGFSMLFTTEKKPVTPETSPLMIPRIPATEDFTGLWVQHLIYSNPILSFLKQKIIHD